MPAAVSAPDVEAVVAVWLRADLGVSHLVDTRVGTQLPASPGWPFVRLVQIGGSVLRGGWAYRALIDVHAYAATKPAARQTAGECQRALSLLTGIVADAVIPGTDVLTDVRWLPDPSWTPPQPRYVFTVAVTYHPLP